MQGELFCAVGCSVTRVLRCCMCAVEAEEVVKKPAAPKLTKEEKKAAAAIKKAEREP